MRIRSIALALGTWLLAAVAASAGPIALGNLSFSVVIPSGATPGVASFTIMNLTGPAWEMPTGYPVSNEIDFTNAELVVQLSTGSQIVNLGTITPGIVDDTVNSDLDFSLASPPLSATFTADLQGLPLVLDSSVGGGSVNVDSFLSTTLTDSGGSIQDGDNADLTVTPEAPGAVPEPAPILLLASGLLLLAGWRRRAACAA
ncbi:MAG: PEP-CTERM sorting domain-containing protein [Terriglobales bacterium]